MTNVEAFPLHWPDYRPRVRNTYSSRFTTSLADARDGLFKELNLLNARNIIVSTNIALRRDGLPYASGKAPQDTAVAVYFKYKNSDMCFACDQYNLVGDNIQAIRKTIEALRGIARWGTGDMMEQAFKGFEALPDHTQQSCWDILGVERDAPKGLIKQAFRTLSKKHHPDMGGAHEEFTKISAAYNEAMKGKS